ncbi:MAG: hypothetical protein R2792_01430 [Saprospiraceae bacterium]
MATDSKKPLLSGRDQRRKKRAKQLSKRAKAVPAKHFLDLLPTELLEQVSEESQVNRQVKHLEGRLMVLPHKVSSRTKTAVFAPWKVFTTALGLSIFQERVNTKPATVHQVDLPQY